MFWKDHWLRGARVVDYAPNLVAVVKRRHVNSRTVKEGLGGEWLRDCGPDLGSATVEGFFLLWGVLANFQLSPERDDSFVWR